MRSENVHMVNIFDMNIFINSTAANLIYIYLLICFVEFYFLRNKKEKKIMF